MRQNDQKVSIVKLVEVDPFLRPIEILVIDITDDIENSFVIDVFVNDIMLAFEVIGHVA